MSVFTIVMHKVYLSLGANVGDREHNIREAVRLLDSLAGHVTRVSSFLETEPWGFSSSHRFINVCVCLTTSLSPMSLLKATQNIESRLGRSAKSVEGRYEDRVIDIDILLYDDLTVNLPELQIPHPLMYKRDFVMIPLKEILQ